MPCSIAFGKKHKKKKGHLKDTELTVPNFTLSKEKTDQLCDWLVQNQTTGIIDAKESDTESELVKQVKEGMTPFFDAVRADGGAQVFLDGANIGHALRQGGFSIFQIDDFVRYFRDTLHKKVRIVMHHNRIQRGLFSAYIYIYTYTIYIYCKLIVVFFFLKKKKALTSQDTRIRETVECWNKDGLLYESPMNVNDDCMWIWAALYSSLIYGMNDVMIVTNDRLRDHGFNLLHDIMFHEFLETHVSSFYINRKVVIDHTKEVSETSENQKRTLEDIQENDEDVAMPPSKKYKAMDANAEINANYQLQRQYGYLPYSHEFFISPCTSFVIRLHVQTISAASDQPDQTLWFVPFFPKDSDVTDNTLLFRPSQSHFSDSLPAQPLSKVRWMVAKSKGLSSFWNKSQLHDQKEQTTE
ncbi:hypothetical protein RFI_25500 [Reticulomyxa filosa]|uniref:PRORP domain-containing protein n=1 Tax=Reticulomyxa filosa TaxID=46433 RepID=X6MER3_RETFI|nr:hypothetical protein RFI_25500 [Reticulomyxa filosa]|eukprot:ETO11877.1 hypothetical protein RFI_25500 [Reticulomyxa filosa]